MKLADFSPAASPSLDQQRDVLQKGLGRTMQWALSGRLEDGPLLEACLRDCRFDAQVEDCRADWLWGIVTRIGAAQRFRVPILHALYDLPDAWSTQQLCGLARHYAAAGDETFRCCLYDVVERKPFPQVPSLGEDDIIRLDGALGLLFVARVRGKLLRHRDWEWDDGNLVHEAIERFGEERVGGLLAASRDEDVMRFEQARARVSQRTHASQQTSGSNPRATHEARMRAITVNEILTTAQQHFRYFGRFRGWGLFADEVDLRAVLQHLWSQRNPVVIANLLKVFAGRPLPEFDPRIIDLCSHDDESVRQFALVALEQIQHPLVADFAPRQLDQGLPEWRALGLFIKNYKPGDEQRILDTVDLPGEDWERHALLMDAIKMLENNPAADCSRLALIAYAATPCENCRCDATRLLRNHRAAPDWLIAECTLDSNEDCRGLALEALAPSDTKSR